jgi:hypothetical protein
MTQTIADAKDSVAGHTDNDNEMLTAYLWEDADAGAIEISRHDGDLPGGCGRLRRAG